MSERPSARVHISEIAEANGWKRGEFNRVDLYFKDNGSLMFVWVDAEGRSAERVEADMQELRGPLGLIKARAIMEGRD